MFVLRACVLLFVLFTGSKAVAQKGGSGPSSKQFGFRVQYGYHDSATDKFYSQIQDISGIDVSNNNRLASASVDLLYMPSAIVYGVRYEVLRLQKASDYSSSSFESDLAGQRLNGLLGWRFLRLQSMYLGLLSHFNLGINTLNYELTTTSNLGVTQRYDYKGQTTYGYGIALEGAYYADDQFPTGLEIGYTDYAATSFKDASGATAQDSTGADLKADVSGLYVRFHVGFVF